MILILIVFNLIQCLICKHKALALVQHEGEFSKDNLDFDKSYYCQPNISQAWCIPKHYNRHEGPFSYAHLSNISLPWHYNFQFSLHEVSVINDVTQTIAMTMYFRVEWFDPRIVIDANSPMWQEFKHGRANEILLPSNSPFWYPDLEIYGLKSFARQQIIGDMGWTKLKTKKRVLKSMYSGITITCQMSFDNYPLDYQVCGPNSEE